MALSNQSHFPGLFSLKERHHIGFCKSCKLTFRYFSFVQKVKNLPVKEGKQSGQAWVGQVSSKSMEKSATAFFLAQVFCKMTYRGRRNRGR